MRWLARDASVDVRCSTPFGITEGGIRATWQQPIVRKPSGAQRLSASQRGACGRQRDPIAPVAMRCSTPFGITEGGMSDRVPVVRDSEDGAQRLSASQRGAFGQRGPLVSTGS